jgi:hypothetical protein
MYQEERQIADPGSDLTADVIPVLGVNRLAVDAVIGGPIVIGAVTVDDVVPGTVISNPADTALPAGTVALPVAPVGTRRMTVQVTVGSALTLVRVRPVGAPAGSGRLLTYLGSTLYGGADGAITPMEVELMAGPVSAVHVDFEG